jgi:uncharacterized protein
VPAAGLAGPAAGPSAGTVEIPPAGARSVHDLAGIINPEHASLIERRHRALLERTGVALAVLTVPRLEGEPIDDFAVRLGQSWGVGRRGEDRGIVIAFALEERRVFVATGYGVEGFLPDGRVGAILDTVAIPHFRRDDFSSGLLALSAALTAAACEASGVDPRELGLDRAPVTRGGRRLDSWQVAAILAAFLAVFFVVAAARSAAGSRGRGRGGPWIFMGPIGGGRIRGGGFGRGFGGGGFGGFGGGGFGGGGAGRGF